MRVGVPKEIKVHEYRVGLTPAAVAELVANGHEVFVETRAGKGIDFSDAGIGDQRISARGFATQFNSRMITMVDGRIATLPGNGLPQGNLLPQSGLDMKAVEVVVGPASALYGPNAHSGVGTGSGNSSAGMPRPASTAAVSSANCRLE